MTCFVKNVSSFGQGLWRSSMTGRYLKFCTVGASGLILDVGLMYCLLSSTSTDSNLLFAKLIAAEVAIINNFIWNYCWTFKGLAACSDSIAMSFGRFNVISLLGVGVSAALLMLQVNVLYTNVYLANIIAVVIVSLVTFFLSLRGYLTSDLSKPLAPIGRV